MHLLLLQAKRDTSAEKCYWQGLDLFGWRRERSEWLQKGYTQMVTFKKHAELIEDARRLSGWQTGSLREAFLERTGKRTKWRGWREDLQVDSLNELFEGRRPDAWRLSEAPWGELVIEFLEVEVTSRLSERKMRDYLHAWWVCEASRWFLFRLSVMDRFGSIAQILDDDMAVAVVFEEECEFN